MHAPVARRASRLLAATAVVGALLLNGAASGADATHPVTIGGSGTAQSPYVYQGVPASITAGDTVSWLNPTTVNHTVTPSVSPDPGFRSHDLDGQGSYHQYRFTVPGSYTFFCEKHPTTMRASLTVRPAPAPTAAPTAAPAPRPAPTPRPVATPAAAPARTAAPSPAPTPTPTPTATATASPTAAATATPGAVAQATAQAGTDTESATTSGGTLPTAPVPPLTGATVDHGGPSLAVVLGLLAVVVGLAAGALVLRRQG